MFLLKKCPKCGKEKPPSGYYPDKRRKDGRSYFCADCVKAWRRRPEQRERDRQRATSETGRKQIRDAKRAYYATPDGYRSTNEAKLRYEYGIDFHDLALLYERQGGRCAGCGEPLRWTRNEHIDHDHQTGQVRGLLCHGCNVALGGARDKPETLEALAAYLRAQRPPGPQ